MAPSKSSSNGGGSKAAAEKSGSGGKKGSSAAANDEWMKEATAASTATKTKEDESTNSTKKEATSTSTTATQMELHDYVWVSAAVFVLYKVLATAYDIRLTSIKEYGPVIHEYDPYFNYRATEVSNSAQETKSISVMQRQAHTINIIMLTLPHLFLNLSFLSSCFFIQIYFLVFVLERL
jgi:flagellar biosynthesis/type III secretory pathway M-ring protein FliF/YscJ